jgi:hypothetical protein
MKRSPKIDTEMDYIRSPKYRNSLRLLLDSHPNGVSDDMICRVLCISKEELALTYERILDKLREVFY